MAVECERPDLAARVSAYVVTGCSAESFRKSAGNKPVKDAGHERLIGQAVFDGDGLEFLQILRGDANIDSPVLPYRVSRVLHVSRDFTVPISYGFPFPAFKRIKDSLFLFVELNFFHRSLLNSGVWLSCWE